MNRRGHLFVIFVSFVVQVFLCALPVRAELVFFHTGRSMSIKSHRVDGESLVLNLRGGGEIVCDRSTIARIEPDEVPWPEPEPPRAEGDLPVRRLPQVYDALIEKVSAEQHVPSKLVKAIVRVESAYQERALSRKGAMGLMQLMPETAKKYGVVDAYDAKANIEAGVRHLKSLLDRLPMALAVAAYNAGEAAVERYHGVPPYAETRAYVKNVLDLIR